MRALLTIADELGAACFGLGLLSVVCLWPGHGHAQPVPYDLMVPYERPAYADALARAKRGDAEAQYWVGMYRAAVTSSDQPQPINKAAALRWLTRSVEQGYRPAQRPYDYLKREEAEFQTLRSAALSGDAEGQYAFATYLLLRGPAANWDTGDTARNWVTHAASLGEFKAMWVLGRMKLNDWARAGRRDASRLAAAIGWLEKSAAQGHQWAIYDLTVLNAPGGLAPDPQRMEHWLMQRGADARPIPYIDLEGYKGRSNSSAEPCLYFEGREVRRSIDLQTASIESRVRREQNFALGRICRENEELWWKATYKLAYYYHYGLGGPANPEKAEALYMGLLLKDGQLQPHGEVAAMLRLALLLDMREKSAEAYKWLRLAKQLRWIREPEDRDSPEYGLTPPSAEAIARIHLEDLANTLLARLESSLPADVRAEQQKAAADVFSNRRIPPPIYD